MIYEIPIEGGPFVQGMWREPRGMQTMGDDGALDTGTEYLLARIEDGVAVLTMNRPERLNALHPEMFRGFGRILPALAANDDVGAIVLTGAGRAFCSGGDVRAQSERAEAAAAGSSSGSATMEARIQDLRQRQAEVSAALYEHPKVTIAAIPGAAAGAGLSIALSCDLRIAAQSALLTTAFAKVGFSGDFGGSWFITQLIGAAKAKELYLTSDKLSADEAARLGLVNKVLPDEGFAQAAIDYARTFANGPRLAYRYIKENVNRAVVSDLRTHLDAEAVGMTRLSTSDDHREAARAFVEKRPPRFSGR